MGFPNNGFTKICHTHSVFLSLFHSFFPIAIILVNMMYQEKVKKIQKEAGKGPFNKSLVSVIIIEFKRLLFYSNIQLSLLGQFSNFQIVISWLNIQSISEQTFCFNTEDAINAVNGFTRCSLCHSREITNTVTWLTLKARESNPQPPDYVCSTLCFKSYSRPCLSWLYQHASVCWYHTYVHN